MPARIKIILVMILYLVSSISLFSQTKILDYKIKNAANSKDRSIMLDLLRANLSKEFKHEFQFVVNHFKVGGDYAWFKGDAKRLDGKAFEFPDEAGLDCCHVESLFKKTNGKWGIAESNAFSTDVWWDGIDTRFPKMTKDILK